ncbi:hypothetical protein SK128_009051, partial [Halocaridina rubra]
VSDEKPKKAKDVLSLQQKLKVLDQLNMMSTSEVVQILARQESNIRSIKHRDKEIRSTANFSPAVSKVSRACGKVLLETNRMDS